MKRRCLGDTGVTIGEIGLGAWQFGGEWGQVSEEACLATLRSAVEAGVNFIDTADVYGAGRSESLIGRFIRETDQELFVATKLGRLHGYPDQYTPALFTKCVDDSLQRLGVERLDLVQLHCIPPHYLASGEVFDWLRDLQGAGKIRHFGASVESMDEALSCLQQPGLASLQIIFNIFRQKPIDVLFDQAKAAGVGLIVRLPLASGLLAGKFSKTTTFADEDHRHFNRDGQAFNVGETFAGLPFEKGVDLADQVKFWTPPGYSTAQMALRWILDYDAVSVVIPGAKDPMQARGNASASDRPPLDPDLHLRLADFYRSQVAEHIRGPY